MEQGEQRRLGAQTEKAAEEGQLQDPGVEPAPQSSPVAEHAAPVQGPQHHGDKAQGRPRDAVDHIEPGGAEAFRVLIMGHQRQGDQGEEFKEDIEGEEVGGKRGPQGHPIGHQVKGKKAAAAVAVRHIGKGVEQGRRPHEGQHGGKQRGHAVHPEGDGKIPCQGENRHRLPGGQAQRQDRQKAGQAGAGKAKHMADMPRQPGHQQQKPAGEQGKQDGEQKQDLRHGPIPPIQSVPNSPTAREAQHSTTKGRTIRREGRSPEISGAPSFGG